jgi:phage-related protein
MEPVLVHFVVNFYGDSKNKLSVVPENWLLSTKNTIPFETYSFYNSSLTGVVVPVRHMLSQFIDFNYNDKQSKYVYKARVLRKFGKSVILKMN